VRQGDSSAPRCPQQKGNKVSLASAGTANLPSVAGSRERTAVAATFLRQGRRSTVEDERLKLRHVTSSAGKVNRGIQFDWPAGTEGDPQAVKRTR